jgi:death-on-curing protein
MSEPKWIKLQLALAAHSRQLQRHGGIEGLRDLGLLESAVARPKNLWSYASPRPDLAALAASYAYGIVRNHPFLDGNKRTAWVACRTFLLINGLTVEATQDERASKVLQLAASEVTEEQFAAWLREALRRS